MPAYWFDLSGFETLNPRVFDRDALADPSANRHSE
jgi:hypothetical protein